MSSLKIPLFIYDGECKFCKMSIGYFRALTKDKVEYKSYQSLEWLKVGPQGKKVAKEFPHISHREFVRSVKLLTPKGGRVQWRICHI